MRCNRCCREKVISITYSECVFITLCIQHAKHMCHTVICDLPGSPLFFRITSFYDLICTFWFSQQLLSENFSFWNEWNLNFLDSFSKNNENPFSVSRGVQCREIDWQKGRQYMMKTIVTFINFANTPKNYERKKRIWEKRIGISSYNVWQWEIQGMRKFLEKYNFSGPFYIFNKSLIN